MSTAEKREVAALASLTVVAGVFSRSLPHRVALADVLLGGAVFLLLQGLVRDLGRVWRTRKAEAAGAPAIQCVCLESSLGVGAIVAGSVLLFAWTPIVIPVSRAAWPFGVAALGAFGFLTKDVVFDWRQRRFGRDPSHVGRLRPHPANGPRAHDSGG